MPRNIFRRKASHDTMLKYVDINSDTPSPFSKKTQTPLTVLLMFNFTVGDDHRSKQQGRREKYQSIAYGLFESYEQLALLAEVVRRIHKYFPS